LILLSVIGAYGLGRATWANFNIFKANRAGQNNQIVEMYQLQQTAIKFNPYLASYHQRWALTNLSIATALANKADLSQEEQTKILQLVQQAIAEGQAATKLQPKDVNHWAVLGQIYRNLIGIVDGADQWAVAAYTTAIQASPTNPNLRIALGEILYQTENFAQAEQFFLQATQLKPNLAKAHYDLANALAKQEKLTAAVVAYENMLTLVEPASEEYQTATTELNAVKTKLGQE
jgi:cytochrome c-type biogenesis protein CcmH/NrfG